MEAGSEMDALVAERIMGWKPEGYFHPGEEDQWEGWRDDKGDGGWVSPIGYSTELDCAWDVVEKMRTIPMGGFILTEQRDGWTAHWAGVDEFAPTAPLAICRAALKAMEEKKW